MQIAFTKKAQIESDVIVLGIREGNVFSDNCTKLDKETSGLVQRALDSSSVKGKLKETLKLTLPSTVPYKQALLLGLGKTDDLTPFYIEALGASIICGLGKNPIENITVDLPELQTDKLQEGEAAAHLAFGIFIRSWVFDKYHTQLKPEDRLNLKNVEIVCSDPEGAEKAYKSLAAIAEGVLLTRNLVSEPANIIYPETMVDEAKKLESLGVSVEVMGEAELKKLGMGAILGVGQGSVRESYVVVLQWKGGAKEEAPVALVGKGVTFDSGGISLKPASKMEDMKMDMAGAAAVLGTFKSLALQKIKCNVVGVIGLVENMPSGSAQRPGDIVKTMSGKTVEVINTDAEGRLILGDMLWYTQDRFKPQVMVNLATLTGAIVVCLGSEYAGIFSNDDGLSNKLIQSGQETDEKLWRMPLGEAFERHIKSDMADIRNVGIPGAAGSISAAQFLQHFVNGVPWAHLDIAGVAWIDHASALSGKGATGFGVRLLNHFLKHNYEK